MIGSKLDADISAKNCRLAFYGRIVKVLKKDEGLEQFKIAKPKQRMGGIEKVVDTYTLLGKDLFSKETPI